MIENWQSDDGQKAMEIMGKPSWTIVYPKGYTGERELRMKFMCGAERWCYDVYGRDMRDGKPRTQDST